MFFVKLHPWALQAVLGISGHEILEQQIEFGDFLRHGEEHPGRLLETGSPMPEIVHCIENWIRARVRRNSPDQAVMDSIQWMLKHRGRKKVQELDGRFMVGRRRLEQLFARHTGISPKNFSRIVRIRAVCQAMLEGAHVLSDLAYAHGFADQAHFSHEFKHFTGLSPRNYLLRLRGKASLYEVTA